MSANSKEVVLVAICGNAVLTILKFMVAVPTHSAAMMNEAIHSLMDTLNQLFLLMGLKSGSRPADRQYAFGHGQKKYLWNLWSAIGLFSIGCGLGFHTPGMLGRSVIASPNGLLLKRAYCGRSIL